MIHVNELNGMTIQQLVNMARDLGVQKWHGMRKDELIWAIRKIIQKKSAEAENVSQNETSPEDTNYLASASKHSQVLNPHIFLSSDDLAVPVKRKRGRPKKSEDIPFDVTGSTLDIPAATQLKSTLPSPTAPKTTPKSKSKSASPKTLNQAPKSVARQRLDEFHARLAQAHDLAYLPESSNFGVKLEEKIEVTVLDPYWLHVQWCLVRSSIERARASLGRYWHEAKPILRVIKVGRDEMHQLSCRHIRDIEIHGALNHWFINVTEPPSSFIIEIGYLAQNKKFMSLIRSETVTTPDETCAFQYEKMSLRSTGDEETIHALKAPAWSPPSRILFKKWNERMHQAEEDTAVYTLPGKINPQECELPFLIDAEVVIYGATAPNAQVTVKNEWVALQPDGTFMIRFDLANRRQIVPITSSSEDGLEQRTIILSIERNTKILDPMFREPDSY